LHFEIFKLKLHIIFFLLLLFPQFSIAENLTPFSDLKINGKSLAGNQVVTFSPLVSLEAEYQLRPEEKFKYLRVYQGSNCSIANKFQNMTSCSNSSCAFGEYRDFDISFESDGNFYHSFSNENRDINFSIELVTANNLGALRTQCYSGSISVTPCDKIINEEKNLDHTKIIELSFVDGRTLEPLDDVQILLSSGPVPSLVRKENGIVEMHSIPRNGFKFAFSRDNKHRYIAGPFENQYSINGLKKLKIALCKDN
jgi:hypothetical protein